MTSNSAVTVNALTGLYCVIGDPIEHSISPQMHNAAFQALNLNMVYLAFRVESSDLNETVRGLKSIDVKGFNITVPHKVAAIRLLDKVDGSVEHVGAVNTVLNERGELKGFNTDGIGFVRAVGENSLKGKRVVVLGAGGAAKAIVYEAALRAASLTILNRSVSKANALADTVSSSLDSPGRNVTVQALPLNDESLERALMNCQLLVNATNVGMYPYSDVIPIPSRLLRSDMTVFDAVYNPLKTKLIVEAEIVGARSISGLEMLLHQGVEAFNIWTGLTPPVDIMRDAALNTLVQSKPEHRKTI